MIRASEPADADDLIRVWLASTIPGQSFLPEDHWRAMEPAIREELMPIAATWVVVEHDELVAFMSLLGNSIGGLSTHPDHQGEGHGRALIEHARERYTPVLVEVFEANEAASEFYRGCGLSITSAESTRSPGFPQLILRLEDPSPAVTAAVRTGSPHHRKTDYTDHPV
jgi:GNAT superfamily N-acetyltransferase